MRFGVNVFINNQLKQLIIRGLPDKNTFTKQNCKTPTTITGNSSYKTTPFEDAISSLGSAVKNGFIGRIFHKISKTIETVPSSCCSSVIHCGLRISSWISDVPMTGINANFVSSQPYVIRPLTFYNEVSSTATFVIVPDLALTLALTR